MFMSQLLDVMQWWMLCLKIGEKVRLKHNLPAVAFSFCHDQCSRQSMNSTEKAVLSFAEVLSPAKQM